MQVLIGAVIGVVGLIAVLGLLGLGIVYSGAFNVAATEDHASLTRWALDTTFHRSVERRASEVPTTPSFTQDMIRTGGAEYKAICQHCHGGPGTERAGWANNMRPRPPHLTEAAAQWRPQEIFWIVKHGIKLSGMPALGPTHDDDRLWNIVAFVNELPAMTPEHYASIPGGEKDHAHGVDRSGAPKEAIDQPKSKDEAVGAEKAHGNDADGGKHEASAAQPSSPDGADHSPEAHGHRRADGDAHDPGKADMNAPPHQGSAEDVSRAPSTELPAPGQTWRSSRPPAQQSQEEKSR